MKCSFTVWIVTAGLFILLNACSPKSAEQPLTAPETGSSSSAISPAVSISKSAAARPTEDRPTTPPPVVPPKTISVPAGTELTVVMIDSISTAKNKAGDQFAASLAESIVEQGITVVEKGTKVHGRIVDAQGSGRVKGRAKIRMVLTGIMDGEKMIPIVTKPYSIEAESTKGRDVAVAGGATGVGAAVGAIAGGKKGAGLGAIIGGAAGTGAVLATKGKEVEFDSESRLKFTLEKQAELPRITRRSGN
jgi:hypothetical protein